jgi:membrane-bound serine protease (ClpP class)
MDRKKAFLFDEIFPRPHPLPLSQRERGVFCTSPVAYCKLNKYLFCPVVAIVCLLMASAFCAAADTDKNLEKNPENKYSHGVLIRIEGAIEPMLAAYFDRKLAVAEAEGADLLILEINSPGGTLADAWAMASRLRDLDFAHTVAYVPKKALSGAAIMALGCDEIIMEPTALIGDAGPIFQDENFQFRFAPQKIVSDLAQEVRGLAAAKGRPPALAEAMVDKSLQVFRVKDKQTGKETCMSKHEIEANPDQWEIIAPIAESDHDRFLELNGQRAVEVGLAQGLAASREELKNRYHLTGELTILEPSAVDTFVYVLYNPLVIAVLIILGLIGLYIEFLSPGVGIGGLIAGLCFALFFWSHFLGGTANWFDVMLFAVGLLCLIAELFVIPGFGIVGLTGVVLILISLILACQKFLIPHNSRELTQLTTTLLIILSSGGGFLLTAFLISKKFGSIPLFSKMMLRPPHPVYGFRDEPASIAYDASATPLENQLIIKIGDVGAAESSLRPAGKARFGTQIVEVATDGDFIPQGRRVEVIEQSGGRIVVREVE